MKMVVIIVGAVTTITKNLEKTRQQEIRGRGVTVATTEHLS